MPDVVLDSVTFKGRYSGATPWIVLHGANPDEIAEKIIQTFGPVDHTSFAELVLRTQELYQTMELLIVQPENTPANGSDMSVTQRAAGGHNVGADVPVRTGSVPTPTCPHGPRVYKEAKPGMGTWKAWMCALSRGTPGACTPEWVKDN